MSQVSRVVAQLFFLAGLGMCRGGALPAQEGAGGDDARASLGIQREFVLRAPGIGVANAIVDLRGDGSAAVGYVAFGERTGTDVFLVRFDVTGDTLWTRSYGGEDEDFGWDIVESGDGGFFLVGYTEAPVPGREDILVLRVDRSGELLWERTCGEAGRDIAWSATATADGGLVIAAESEDVTLGERDAYVLRIEGDGEERWHRRVASPGDQRVYHVTQTSDGAFVVTGTSAERGEVDRDVYVVRLDPEGRVVWTRSFGGAPDDVGHGVMALEDGAVLVTGYGATRSNGSTDVYYLRLDRRGGLVSWQHHGGAAQDRAMMSAPRPGGGYVTVGFSGVGAASDIVILENDADGRVQTRTVLERAGGDRGVMIAAAHGGGYVLAGTLGGEDSATGDFAVLWLSSPRASTTRSSPPSSRVVDRSRRETTRVR